MEPISMPSTSSPIISSSKHHGVVPQHSIQVASLSFDTTITGQRPQFISWKGMHHVGILGREDKNLATSISKWDHLSITWVEMRFWWLIYALERWFPPKRLPGKQNKHLRDVYWVYWDDWYLKPANSSDKGFASGVSCHDSGRPNHRNSKTKCSKHVESICPI